MNFISFIIGVIVGVVGLDSRRRVLLIRWVLSCITAGFAMKTIHTKLYIWDIEDYNLTKNFYQFFHSALWWQSGLLVITVYLLFYYFLHLVIDKTVLRIMDKKIKRAIAASNQAELHSFIQSATKGAKKIILIALKVRIFLPRTEMRTDTDYAHIEMGNKFKSTFLLSLHILLCSFMLNKVFSLNVYFLITVVAALMIILFLFFYIIKVIPLFKYLNKMLFEMLRDIHKSILEEQE